MNKVAIDLFGDIFEPGDFFVYAPGAKRHSNMTLGIFIRTERKAFPPNKMSSTMIDIALVHFVNMDLKDEPDVKAIVSIPLESFARRSAIIHEPAFQIKSALIQRGLQTLDLLRDRKLL